MSAVQSIERFEVGLCYRGAFAYYGVMDLAHGEHVDIYRSESAARYAAKLLNRGVATIDPHAVVGCRVIAR